MKFIFVFIVLLSVRAMGQFKNYREVVILPNGKQIQLKNQLDEFAKDSQGIKERDIKVTVCENERCKSRFKSNTDTDPFTVMLIGKDGGTKSTWSKTVTTKELFAIIDAMPMRRSEMSGRNQDVKP